MHTSRRSFLRGAGLVAMPMILPHRLFAQATKPSNKLNVGCIGMGTQMRGVMGGFRTQDDVIIRAVCDVDTTRREAGLASMQEFYTAKPERGDAKGIKAYTDYRELLADSSLDAIIIATPDHWHAIQTLEALKAKKDVYCEKPLTHNVQEAVAVMAAVKKYGRVLQTGSMQRSANPEFRVASELVRNGVIGTLKSVEIYIGAPAVPYDLPEEAMEPGLDWDRWCGPAPKVKYNAQLSPRGVHKNFPAWRRYREFATGMIGDWGAHHIDIAHWAMGMDESGPVEVLPSQEKDNQYGVTLKYANGVAVTHTRGPNGLRLIGDAGMVYAARGKFHLALDGKDIVRFIDKEQDKTISCEGAYTKASKLYLKDAKIKLEVSKNHVRNFLDCVASRNKPITSEIVGGHTAIACHLMSQGYYHRERICWDPAKFAFTQGTGNPAWLTREYREGYRFPTV